MPFKPEAKTIKLRAQVREWLADHDAAFKVVSRYRFKVAPIRKRLRVSPRQLEQIFTEEAGKTPLKWASELRFERAKELLRGGWDVAYVAKKVEFSAVSNFCREFKNKTGERPGEYQSRFL